MLVISTSIIILFLIIFMTGIYGWIYWDFLDSSWHNNWPVHFTMHKLSLIPIFTSISNRYYRYFLPCLCFYFFKNVIDRGLAWFQSRLLVSVSVGLVRLHKRNSTYFITVMYKHTKFLVSVPTSVLFIQISPLWWAKSHLIYYLF